MPANYEIYPEKRELCWRASDPKGKTITVENKGNGIEILVEIVGPSIVGKAHFDWNAVPKFLAKPGTSHDFTVRPPVPGPGTGPTMVDVLVRLYETNGVPFADKPVHCHNDCVARLTYGDLAISGFIFNPPGSDLAGEGEYVEITNLTDRSIDMTGCRMTQLVFNQNPAWDPREESLVVFAVDPARIDFGSTCILAPKATLRILTRSMVTGEGPSTTRYYLGRGSPIWNNTGDRLRVKNDFNDVLASFGYGSQAKKEANRPALPAPPDQDPTPPQKIVFSTEFNIDPSISMADSNSLFTLEDGDTLTISTTEGEIARRFIEDDVIMAGTIGLWTFSPEFLPSGERLLILPRRIGGLENSPDVAGWPLPGAPVGALIALISTTNSSKPFVVGAGFKGQVTVDRPTELRLGVNDNVLAGNRGHFVVVVRVER